MNQLTNNRRNLVFIAAALIVVAIVITFPLWRPLFVNNVVNESFPGLTGDAQATFQAYPVDRRAAYAQTATANPNMAGTMVSAAVATDTNMTEPMPDSASPSVLSKGSFVRIDAIHAAEGTATIYQLADGSRVLRFEDFRATNGPDLHVFLSTVAAPKNHDELGTVYTELGNLKGNVGNQNYAIPAEVDLATIKSIVIYCKPFQVVFSHATLG